MDEDKRQRGVLSTHPLVDTLAFFCIFLQLPTGVQQALFLIYLAWKVWYSTIPRRWTTRIAFLATVVSGTLLVVAPALYEPLNIYALAIIAACVAGTPDWIYNAGLATVLSYTIRLSVHWYRILVLQYSPSRFLPLPKPFPTLVTHSVPFNTLRSTWNLMWSLADVLERLDWAEHSYILSSNTLALAVIASSVAQSIGLISTISPGELVAHSKALSHGRGRSRGTSLSVAGQPFEISATRSARSKSDVEPGPPFAGPQVSSLFLFPGPNQTIGTTIHRPADTERSKSTGRQPPPETAGLVPASVSGTAPKRRRRAVQVWLRQPLWTALALLKLMFARQNSAASHVKQMACGLPGGVPPHIRFVEESQIGLTILDPEGLEFKVDGVTWMEVFCDNKRHLAVISGLAPGATYSMEVLDESRGFRISFHASTRMVESVGSEGREQRSPEPLGQVLDRAKDAVSLERAKLKRMRRDNQKQLAMLRGEIESQAARDSKSSKADEKYARRIQHLEDLNRQLKQDVAGLEATVAQRNQDAGVLRLEHEKHRLEWQQEKEKFDTSRAEADNETRRWQAEKKLHTSQLDKATQQAEGLRLRREKLAAETASIQASAETALEQFLGRRRAVRLQNATRNAKLQRDFQDSIEKLRVGQADLERKIQDMARP